MAKTTDPVALNQWYAVASREEVTSKPYRTRLLGQDIVLQNSDDGVEAREVLQENSGLKLPVQERFGCLWTTLGQPDAPIFGIAESEEADRRYVPCGWFNLRASGLRIVENFLDMAHFPFVHTDILGAEPHTDVPKYEFEIRRDVDEVWATNCTFFQPQVTAGSEGAFAQLTYRVPTPFTVMLYRVSPSDPSRLDAIAAFIQPIEEDFCRAIPVMYLVDPDSSHTALLKFEQVIFAQDKIIVENQRPILLPLHAQDEIPTRADGSSVAYRRWLKEKGLTYGTTSQPKAAA
ncbi:MAG: aromatic ring-hydroxylating dioxygenase subunit alpha [Hyphomicrobiales bacterium]